MVSAQRGILFIRCLHGYIYILGISITEFFVQCSCWEFNEVTNMFSTCIMVALSCWNKPSLPGNMLSIKEYKWSTTRSVDAKSVEKESSFTRVLPQ